MKTLDHGHQNKGSFSGHNRSFDVENVLPFAISKMEDGCDVCLITLVFVDGSAPRAVGAQMAVCDDGTSVGSFTGGCLEGAVAAEALDALSSKTARLVRFGKDSPYFDVVLPCGSGLDLHFDPAPHLDALKAILASQAARQPATLLLPEAIRFGPTPNNAPQHAAHEPGFMRAYVPTTKLMLAGDSVALHSLRDLATQAGIEVSHLDADLSRQHHDVALDRWTAIALLFHEHENELVWLEAALRSDCFYVGALGSARAQQIRTSRLRESGFSNADIARIRAPIGLIPEAKTPIELAVSILADVVDAARALRG